MAIYFQHVGERGGLRDFPKTIGDEKTGLRQFLPEDVTGLDEALGPEEFGRLNQTVASLAPNGFQVWGIPSGAKSVIANLREGDWFFLLTSDMPGGQFYYAGQVLFRVRGEHFDISRGLWGEARFPLLILLRGGLTSFTWEAFRTAFGYKSNWRLSGQTYRLTPERISMSQYADEARVVGALLGTATSADGTGEFSELIDQVELLIESREGRQLLREHLVRERDSTLIRDFKRGLSDFSCSVCRFDFEAAYGALGRGFIEAHHVDAIGLREGSTETSVHDLIGVCSNCHRMLHRQTPMLTAQQLADVMAYALQRRSAG